MFDISGLFFEIDRASGTMNAAVCDSMIKHGARLPTAPEQAMINKLQQFLMFSTRRAVTVTQFVSPSYATALEQLIHRSVNALPCHFAQSRLRLISLSSLPSSTD